MIFFLDPDQLPEFDAKKHYGTVRPPPEICTGLPADLIELAWKTSTVRSSR